MLSAEPQACAIALVILLIIIIAYRCLRRKEGFASSGPCSAFNAVRAVLASPTRGLPPLEVKDPQLQSELNGVVRAYEHFGATLQRINIHIATMRLTHKNVEAFYMGVRRQEAAFEAAASEFDRAANDLQKIPCADPAALDALRLMAQRLRDLINACQRLGTSLS
jgi:hypothetical protein